MLLHPSIESLARLLSGRRSPLPACRLVLFCGVHCRGWLSWRGSVPVGAGWAEARSVDTPSRAARWGDVRAGMPRLGDSVVVEGVHQRTRYSYPCDSAYKQLFSLTNSDTYMDGGVAACPPPQLLSHSRPEGVAAPERKRSPCLPPLPLPSARASTSSPLSAWVWWRQWCSSWPGEAWLSPPSFWSSSYMCHLPCCASWPAALCC